MATKSELVADSHKAYAAAYCELVAAMEVLQQAIEDLPAPEEGVPMWGYMGTVKLATQGIKEVIEVLE